MDLLSHPWLETFTSVPCTESITLLLNLRSLFVSEEFYPEQDSATSTLDLLSPGAADMSMYFVSRFSVAASDIAQESP